jgi:hypothetical protein
MHLTAQTTEDPVLIICTPMIFALEQNGWQRKPVGHVVVATLCKLNDATDTFMQCCQL